MTHTHKLVRVACGCIGYAVSPRVVTATRNPAGQHTEPSCAVRLHAGGVRRAESHSDEPHHHHRAGRRDPPPAGSRRVLCARNIPPRVAAFCGLPHRDPRPLRPFLFRFTTRPGPRAARSSRRVTCGAARAFGNG
ncbi:hypothetical protein EVAR_25045_1 [Eumeta japonica]|uniref:Uncharacterized protein n=1 Tax=Eumeta variegata TaxID=151549 RepID=A0A4C1V807_EUMVA|nr:hypothetical protein EVAR_25045_1 [Eumeta japonica]